VTDSRTGAMLAIPRRVYTQSHIDYVAEVVIALSASRGARLPLLAPQVLRHFNAVFEED
jgi:tryptophanase